LLNLFSFFLPLNFLFFLDLGSGVNVELNEKGKQQAQALGIRFRNEGKPVDSEMKANPENMALEDVNSERYEEKGISVIICSHLTRAVQTANIVNEALPAPVPILIDENLAEISWGDWEGKAMKNEASYLSSRWANGFRHEKAPNGESIQEAEERIFTFLNRLKSLPHERIAIISHGKILTVLLSHLIEANNPQLRQPLSENDSMGNHHHQHHHQNHHHQNQKEDRSGEGQVLFVNSLSPMKNTAVNILEYDHSSDRFSLITLNCTKHL